MMNTIQENGWESQAAEWVQQHVSPELLDAWLFEPTGEMRSFEDVWVDLKRARMMVLCVAHEDRHHALVDLYCASYRWHLACANPMLPPTTRHHKAMIAAVAEVWATESTPEILGVPFMATAG